MLTNLYLSNIQIFNANIDTQDLDATFGFGRGTVRLAVILKTESNDREIVNDRD